MERARIVARRTVHHSALPFHNHRVIGKVFDSQIDVLGNYPLVIVGIVGVLTVEFVARERVGVVVLSDIACMVSVEGDVAVLVAGILETPSAEEFVLGDI